MLEGSELLEEQSKTRNDETESHQCQPCANPCQQGSLGGQIVRYCGFVNWCRGIHPYP